MNSTDVPSAYQTFISTLQALIELPDYPKHCYEESRWGQDDSKACDQYLGISEQTAHHRWNVHMWGLVAAATQERRDKAREGFLWHAKPRGMALRCLENAVHFQSWHPSGCRLILS